MQIESLMTCSCECKNLVAIYIWWWREYTPWLPKLHYKWLYKFVGSCHVHVIVLLFHLFICMCWLVAFYFLLFFITEHLLNCVMFWNTPYFGSCNFLNFARNRHCLECKADGPKKIAAATTEMKMGDWICTQ